ncbi:MAG TPA: hypothetical protein VHB21_15255 [Minicystis sp.]|nr:hypothetical protein [Minicystis sp.]
MTRNEERETPEAGAQAAQDDGEPKKERVLHTRIPAVLERDLKRLARQLRVPVSNLVRAVLEDALRVADAASGVVEGELTNVARAVSRERENIQRRLKEMDGHDEVLGFQPMVLAQPTECARCHKELARGARGWLGLRATPGPAIVVCADCVPET